MQSYICFHILSDVIASPFQGLRESMTSLDRLSCLLVRTPIWGRYRTKLFSSLWADYIQIKRVWVQCELKICCMMLVDCPRIFYNSDLVRQNNKRPVRILHGLCVLYLQNFPMSPLQIQSCLWEFVCIWISLHVDMFERNWFKKRESSGCLFI